MRDIGHVSFAILNLMPFFPFFKNNCTPIPAWSDLHAIPLGMETRASIRTTSWNLELDLNMSGFEILGRVIGVNHEIK